MKRVSPMTQALGPPDLMKGLKQAVSVHLHRTSIEFKPPVPGVSRLNLVTMLVTWTYTYGIR